MPGTASGLASVPLGISAFEGTYGAVTAIDRRLTVRSNTVALTIDYTESQGITGDLDGLSAAAGRVSTGRQAAGDTVHELNKNGLGRILNAMTGGTSTITQEAATIAWLQTHTHGSLLGKSLNLQQSQRDDAGAQIMPKTHHGAKVASWTLNVPNQELPTLTVNWFCEDEDKTTATTAMLALPVQTGGLFDFTDVSLTLNGVPAARVLEITLTCNNALKTDSRFLGGGGLVAEPMPNTRREYSGSFTAEFTDPAMVYDRFTANTGIPLVVSFVGNIIASTFAEELTFTLPQVHFNGDSPVISGPDLITQTGTFLYRKPTAGTLPSIKYRSTDTAI